jgi:uncharacterized protein (TIGR00255 family)
VLLSMTGFGDARGQNDRLSMSVEVRAVNNRYFKLVTKTPERYQPFESEIERVVRESISRGTVNVSVRIEGVAGATAYRLDAPVLQGYWQQLTTLSTSLGIKLPDNLSGLLVLPGVVGDGDSSTSDPREDWPLIESSLRDALKKFREFRVVEGGSMEKDLQQNLRIISTELETIAARAPQIVRDFRDKIRDRVADLLRDGEATVEPNDLIREVSIYAERCDISEEILRLRSHLDQFQAFIRQQQSAGRKLDFLTQEMVREVNTIGSKANNAEVAHSVVEIKAAVERMREVLQNVE